MSMKVLYFSTELRKSKSYLSGREGQRFEFLIIADRRIRDKFNVALMFVQSDIVIQVHGKYPIIETY